MLKGEALGSSLHHLPIHHPAHESSARPRGSRNHKSKIAIYQCVAPSESPLEAEVGTPNHCLHDLLIRLKRYVPKKAVKQVNAFFPSRASRNGILYITPLSLNRVLCNRLLSGLSPQRCWNILRGRDFISTGLAFRMWLMKTCVLEGWMHACLTWKTEVSANRKISLRTEEHTMPLVAHGNAWWWRGSGVILLHRRMSRVL